MTKRVFFAFDLSNAAIDQIQAIRWPTSVATMRAVPVRNWHITLQFIGKVNDSQLKGLANIGAAIKAVPFIMTLTQVRFFKRAGVVCLSCPRQQRPDPLIMLQHQLRQAVTHCDPEIESLRVAHHYVPHLTLFRKAKQCPQLNLDPISWTVTSFALYESCSSQNGVVYERLEHWPLITKPE